MRTGPTSIGLAQSLVRIPSENKQPHGSEKACQMFVADYLRDIGCRVDVFTPLEVAGPDRTPRVLAGARLHRPAQRRRGAVAAQPERPGGQGRGAQVAPVHRPHRRRADRRPGQYGWWDGTVEDGKLYGRGSNDMKGGIAAYLMAARCVRELGLELKGDLILETVVDEEFGGANGTLACRLRGYNADLAILPEPNNMLISTAHRGGQQFRLFACAEGVGMGFGETVLRDPVTGPRPPAGRPGPLQRGAPVHAPTGRVSRTTSSP